MALQDDLVCPLCLSTLTEPVLASDGFTYDLTCLKQAWAVTKEPTLLSPFTREPLPRRLVANVVVCQLLGIDTLTALRQACHAFSTAIEPMDLDDEEALFLLLDEDLRGLTQDHSVFCASALTNFLGYLRYTHVLQTLGGHGRKQLMVRLKTAYDAVFPMRPTQLADYDVASGIYKHTPIHRDVLKRIEERYPIAHRALDYPPLTDLIHRCTNDITFTQEWMHSPRPLERVIFWVERIKWAHASRGALEREMQLHHIELGDTDWSADRVARVLARRQD